MTCVKQRALAALRCPVALIHGFEVPYPKGTVENPRELAACFGRGCGWIHLIDCLEEQMEILLALEVGEGADNGVYITGRLGTRWGTRWLWDQAPFPFSLVDFLAKLRKLEADLLSGRGSRGA